jgi:ribosomal protein L7/L12
MTEVLAVALLVVGGLLGLMAVIARRSRERSGLPAARGLLPGTQPGTWSLVLEDAGAKRIQVIKEIRAVTGLGLAEAKGLTDRTPSTVLSDIDHASASAAYRALANAGARVRMSEVRTQSAAAPADPAGAYAGGYAVVVDDAGAKRIQVIKEIRAVTGLGLAEAKGLTDRTPSTVLSGVDHATATAAHGRLTGAGAVARVVEA